MNSLAAVYVYTNVLFLLIINSFWFILNTWFFIRYLGTSKDMEDK